MNNETPTIFLIDDDPELLGLLQEYLQGEGFTVVCATRGNEALEQLRQHTNIAAVVLDIMMPGISGLELLKQLRQFSNVPVIMLTGRGDDIDRIVGLELGADDYLGKPCNPRELSARLRAILRRSQPVASSSEDSIVTVGVLQLDRERLKATVAEQVILFTSTEFRTLLALAVKVGRTISKEALTEQILQRKLSLYDRSMDVHISRIRHKLAEYPELMLSIQSVRGIGYQLVLDCAQQNSE
jgi:DNA-binding response OmpR family regulator